MCARAAWKNALVEVQHGRKGMTPKYSQIEGKPFKVACQSRRALVQHTKCAQPPSRFMY